MKQDIDAIPGEKWFPHETDFEADMPVYSDNRVWRIHTHDAPGVTTKMRLSHTENSITDYYHIRSVQKEGRLHTILIAEAFDDE